MKSRVLCVIQMNWSAQQYRNQDVFESKIRSLVEQCRRESENGEMLVVFPEDVGTPLMLLNAPDWVFRTNSMQTAIKRLIVCHLFKTLKYKLQYGTGWIRSLALAGVNTVAKAYFQTFSKLAREYRIYLAAGSVLLPDMKKTPERPWEQGSPYKFEGSDIYNICYLFGPDGRIIGSQKKVYLVPGLEDEKGFDIVNGFLTDISTFDSPFGKLGIAICLDGFQKDVLQALVDQGAQILIQPSANCRLWDKEEQEVWMTSAWTAVNTMDFQYAVNPMMTGCLFDLCFEGQSSILQKGYSEKTLGYKALLPSKHFMKIAENGDSEEIITVHMDEEQNHFI